MVRSGTRRRVLRLHELRRTVGSARAAWIAPLWAIARRYVVIARDLTDVSDLPVASAEFVCRGLESSSPAELASFDPRLSVAEIERRVQEGQTCEIWRHEGTIVHFRWLIAAPASLPFLGLDFRPRDGDCLLYEVFTLTDNRVRGVHSQVARHSLRRASLAGNRRMLALCAWWNVPALRVGEKSGFERTGAVTRWQMGPVATFTATGEVEVSGSALSVPGSRGSRDGSNRDEDGERTGLTAG